MWMNAQTCEECAGFIGCPTCIRQDSFGHLSEAFPLLRDHSLSTMVMKNERRFSKKKLDALALMHSCCIPVLKEWPFYRGWEESIDSNSSASLMHEGAQGPVYPSSGVAWKLQCHKATGVGQDPTLIHVWEKVMQKDGIFLCHTYDSHVSKPCNFKIV